MKTITIELNNDLERKLNQLSQAESQDISTLVVKVLSYGLSEQDRRTKALRTLNAAFAQPVPSPFNELDEKEVMQMVDEEIGESRKTN